MILIWGFKSYVDLMATGNTVCSRCHNPAAHRLHRVRKKFTFFWIPLFTTSTKHLLDCTFCGHQSQLTAEEAERTAAALNAAHGAPSQQPQGQPQQQPGQHF